MQFKQADILSGLDKEFIGRLMAAGIKTSIKEGDVLFNEGDPARYFYILLKGRIRLSTGENKSTIYTVNHGGEAFGWSSLTDRKEYAATAMSLAPSTLIAFDHDQIERILSENPADAVMFYKNLTLTLGNRLMLVTSQLSDNLSVADKISYGTGQVQETVELI